MSARRPGTRSRSIGEAELGRGADDCRRRGPTATREIARHDSTDGGLQMHASTGRRFSMAAMNGRL
jgi:hypothetical protein